MSYQPPIRGNFIKNKLPIPKVGEDTRILEEIKSIKKDTELTAFEKIDNFGNLVDNAEKIIEIKTNEIKNMTENAVIVYENAAVKVIEEVQSLKQLQGEKGDPGKDADEELIVQRLVAKIPKPQEIDVKKLKKEFLAAVPVKKADLKIIQEKIEVDPLSVVEKIMALPEGKFKLKTNHIDGLEQTISAFRSQLGRGYLHGGGLSTVAHDSTLTGDGTPAHPLVVVGGGGTGITSINTDTTAAQTLTTGTTGTDFAIVDNGSGDHKLNLPTASSSNRGALSSADWSTFNNKQGAGNYITALTGDVTASGPGSSATTLATVNSNVGSFTNANITVNAKGLVTAASSGTGGSGITRSVNSISTPTTAGATASTDYIYLVTGTTTLTLPTAVGNTNRYSVKRVGTNTVTIATTSAQTIDGSSTATLLVQYVSIDLISDGANWNVI